VDPVTAELVRQGLNSAAAQMKQALIRAAFSPVIYEVLDFAVALYDCRYRLLAQAPSLPLFMGRLGFCVEAAVAEAGGEDTLEPGDVLLYNLPFGTGSHPQDAALVMPVFLQERDLIGYAAVKGHWLDVGAVAPYATDTRDMHQEGTLFPGLRLHRGGQLVRDVQRLLLANTRLPRMVAGDVQAEVAAVRIGAVQMARLAARHGPETFRAACERMLDHGEAVVRGAIAELPDGRYVARGRLDDDGVGTGPVPFEVTVEVAGSEICLDFSGAPDARPGPVNCPLPKTVAASRVAVLMLAGKGESPNEGHFRPITVRTRPGSLFHPLPPAPTFIGGWPAIQAIEVIYRALARRAPRRVPAWSGGCICSLVWWGTSGGQPWAEGAPHPVGQGADAAGDGASSLMHHAESATRLTPIEVSEQKAPWLVEWFELAPDSGGAGAHRGGLGIDLRIRLTEDAFLTAVVERTGSLPVGLHGGRPGRPNRLTVREGGRRIRLGKITRRRISAGSAVELRTGGGGGYGPPSERDPESVRRDLREGYVTLPWVRRHHPGAVAEATGNQVASGEGR
jgi:N-methylhydantoinase B